MAKPENKGLNIQGYPAYAGRASSLEAGFVANFPRAETSLAQAPKARDKIRSASSPSCNFFAEDFLCESDSLNRRNLADFNELGAEMNDVCVHGSLLKMRVAIERSQIYA